MKERQINAWFFQTDDVPVFQKSFDESRRRLDPIAGNRAFFEQIDDGEKQKRFMRRGLAVDLRGAELFEFIQIKRESVGHKLSGENESVGKIRNYFLFGKTFFSPKRFRSMVLFTICDKPGDLL